MKLAHMVVITPGRCGLYETTRELVKALRYIRIDSRMVDPTRATNTLYPEGTEDRGAPFADMDWAVTADIIVCHSGYDTTPVQHTDQPIIYIAHGRPRSSFLGELAGKAPIYTYHRQKNADPRWKAVATFWPEHVKYHEVMFPDKPVYTLTAPVDLEYWSPGPARYDFGGKGGKINVVCSDAWRDDIDPFEAVNEFARWARTQDGAKLHLYGKVPPAKGWGALLGRIHDDGNMGESRGWVKGLREIYRAADFVLTSHAIDVRTVREAQACGCDVVRVGEPFTKGSPRESAERAYDPRNAAMDFLRMLSELFRERKTA